MTYTAPGAQAFRNKAGSLAAKVTSELALIDSAIDSAKIQIVDLTASAVNSSDLASNGVDLASGTNHTFYAVFVAPVACTIVSMDVLITEAYVKETTSAKIELKTEAASPVTKCTTTLADAVAAKTILNVTPTDTALAAGTILNIVTTESASSTGTGHAKVFMRYIVN